jgi:hypothetical protein
VSLKPSINWLLVFIPITLVLENVAVPAHRLAGEITLDQLQA